MSRPFRTGWGILKTRGIWIIGGFLFLTFYFLFDPLQSSFMPRCLFHRLTGLQCIGCGSQRVLHSLLHGDFREAFLANAFLVCILPVIVFYLWLETRRVKKPVLYARAHSLPVIVMAGILLFSWLILRNIFGI